MCSLLAPYLLGCLDEWFPEMKGCACQHTHTHTRGADRHEPCASASSLHGPPRSKQFLLLLHLSLPLSGVAAPFFLCFTLTLLKDKPKKNNKGELKISCCWHPRNTEAHYPVARLTLMSHVQGQHDAILMVVTQHSDRGVDAVIAAPEAESRWINNGKMQVMSPGKKKKMLSSTCWRTVPFRCSLPPGAGCHDDAADCSGRKEEWWLSPNRPDWFAKKIKIK